MTEYFSDRKKIVSLIEKEQDNIANLRNYIFSNLWIVDERLLYYTLISKKNDLIVMSDQEISSIHTSIAIITIPTNDNNPIHKLLNSLSKIKKGEVKDMDGNFISIHPLARFYLYTICDITANLKEILEEYAYNKTPDGLGGYFYHDIYRANIEIIPIEKLIADANKKVIF